MSTGNPTVSQHAEEHHEHHHFAHHFRNALHEFITTKEGVWLFMVTEILMFGGLFVGYFLMHEKFPATFAEGSSHLNWMMGGFNTIVLIMSSWTMALSIHWIQTGKNSRATFCLIFTLLCGATFMVVKFFEYKVKFEHGLLPGKFFHAEDVQNANLAMFFGFYFCMTGMHGLHVLIGMSLITWVLIRHLKGEFGPEYFTPVEGVGLFWHVVDLIWIFLFPLLYLVG